MVLKMSFCIILSYFLYKGLVFYIVKINCNCMYFILGCSGVSNIVFLVIVELFLVVSYLLICLFRVNEMKDSLRFFGVLVVICYVC